MGSKNGVVGFDNSSGDLRSWVNTELKLAFLAVVDGQTFHQKSTKTRSSTTTEGVEDQETLKTRAVVGNTSNLVQNLIDELFANGIMATSVVVGGVLLSSDHLFRVEKAAIGTSSDLIDNIGFEIAVDGARDIFSLTLGMVR